MSSPDEVLSDRTYIRYKLIVKKWEKSFFKQNGRIPSKYDIKEAAVEVRKAYSKYFQLKSRAIEGVLADIEIVSPTNSPPASPTSLPPSPACDLPSGLQIQQLISTPIEAESSDRVWGAHLNNSKLPENKTLTKSRNATPKVSPNLFRSYSFNIRNPRKSFSSKNPKKSKSPDANSNRSTDNVQELTQESSLEQNLFQNNIFDVVINENPNKPVNVNQSVLSGAAGKSARIINIDWLDRCTSQNGDSVQNKETSEVVNLVKCQEISASDVPFTSNDDHLSNYGLRNINVAPIVPDVGDSIESNLDIIENSESENEDSLSLSQLRRIKPIIKKPKIESNIEELNETHTPKESGSKGNNKNKNLNKPKISKKKKVTKKKVKEVIDEPSQMEDDLDEFNMLNDDKIEMPRYAINSSILKEKNLVEGLTATLKLPRQSKSKKKATESNGVKENELQKKIESGTLNENFVRINIEKKVFVRGKKSINYSKFKKQMWKNKKKALHELGPEFPDGGILKCFTCNGIGHMTRYCQARKGNSLLPLEECTDKSDLLTLKEAESSQCIEENSLNDDIVFEPMTAINDSSKTEENTSDKPSQTYLKLLPKISKSIASQTIEPLYPLNTDFQPIECTQEVKDALKLFGYTDFRNGQETAIMRILSGLSTLVTLSTGSGKSLCYQLPAYIYAQRTKCITLVISPLVSLMEDQIVNMPSFLHAGCLHTNQTATQRENILQLLKDGNIDVLLVSPEAVISGERSSGFGGLLKHLPPIAFACIDEVHCVSQWSHNFRPSYLMICRVLREKMGVKCILGLTATATRSCIESIIEHLNIYDGFDGVITNVPLPKNLVLTVSKDKHKDRLLLELLQTERFSSCNSTIVYCIRRDECERIATLIRTSLRSSNDAVAYNNADKKVNRKRKRFNYLVEAYHAGMSASKRRSVQENFMNGQLKIVVATVAFGMGINKADIRSVIHYNMPSSFESYVQEVGRAGRDGLPAQCHVFIDNDAKDMYELLRHIHANSIERHVIRKLLQKVFIPCSCRDMNIERCQGHEVAFSVEDTVRELDIPAENISTLLCYLELHNNNYIKVLSNVYTWCKISSYGGPSALAKAAQDCPPLAMAIALEKNKGNSIDNLSTFEFHVVDAAAAIGWESGLVKYHLKNLEWDKSNDKIKKSLLRVEFNTLGFRVKAPGDLEAHQLDTALDSLYERTQLQEKTMLMQLHKVSKTLLDVSFPSIHDCTNIDSESEYMANSDKLKDYIREYFNAKMADETDIQLHEKSFNENRVLSDIKGLIATYKDCTFTGRAIARILQGISSPNYPAIVWGRCRYWRSHISEDFYKICDVAKKQIILMR